MTTQTSCHKILWTYWKIIGVCPLGLNCNGTFNYSNRHPYYAILLTLTFVVLIIREEIERLSIGSLHDTSISLISTVLCTFLEYGVIFGAWLNIGFRQNLVRRIAKNFMKIRTLMNDIRVPLNHDNEILRGVQIFAIIVNVTWVSLIIMANYDSDKSSVFIFTFSIIANVPRVVTHNIVLTFVYIMKYAKINFHIINASVERDFVRTQRFVASEFFVDSTHMDLTKLSKIHGDIVNLVESLVNLYSISVVLNLVVNYVQVATAFYMFCVFICYRNSAFSDDALNFVQWVLWFLLHLVEIIATIDACDSVIQEAKRYGNILHRAFISDSSDDYAQQITTSLKLLQRPFQIKIHGLEINSALLVTISGSITTYTVIMMQLDQQVSDSSMNRTKSRI